eukprot:TRINITY_DN57508_c0_g1_i1.p1 TRINITY_DN57508_c0_g1~~TRINITY_DN57508_c0_g1_i1.p1  ORF type:complete len:292 (-),score=63.53 TRINITY_DN57508_c0_g1_i1:286-1161(-)
MMRSARPAQSVMEATLSNVMDDLSSSCASAVKALRAAAEQDLASAREELRRREDAVADREARVAKRESDLEAKWEEAMSRGTLTNSSCAIQQVPLVPTPSRTRSSPLASSFPAEEIALPMEDWGLSPLRSVRDDEVGEQQRRNKHCAELEAMGPSPTVSLTQSSVTDDFLQASPPPSKPRPAGVPALPLAANRTPARNGSPDISPHSEAACTASPQVSDLKAMFEPKKNDKANAKGPERRAGPSASIAAAAFALKTAASVADGPKEPAAPTPQKVSLQELLRLDEERRGNI